MIVDRLTKYAHFGALPTQYTAAKVAQVFVDLVVKHHGYPSTIITDRDHIFISQFWNKLCELNGTKLKQSTTYHPQTDGQTEVVNRELQQYLRAFVSAKPNCWFNFLSWAEFSYNSHYHSGLKMSPFKALYGRDPPTIPVYTTRSTKIQSLDELLVEMTELLKTLKHNLEESRNRMKMLVD